MRPLHFLSALLVSLAFTSAPASADEPPATYGRDLAVNYNVEARAYYWLSAYSANIRADNGSLQGTNVDLVNDLGLERNKGVPSVSLSARFWDRNRIHINYVGFAYSANQAVSSSFVFNGATYPTGSRVATDMTLSFTRFGYEFELYKSEGGAVGIGLAGDAIRTKTTLVTNQILSNSADASVVVPMLSLSGRFSFGQWASLHMFLAGIGYEQSSAFDFEAMLDITPIENVAVSLGFRNLSVNVEASDTKADVQWSGATVGVAFRY